MTPLFQTGAGVVAYSHVEQGVEWVVIANLQQPDRQVAFPMSAAQELASHLNHVYIQRMQTPQALKPSGEGKGVGEVF